MQMRQAMCTMYMIAALHRLAAQAPARNTYCMRQSLSSAGLMYRDLLLPKDVNIPWIADSIWKVSELRPRYNAIVASIFSNFRQAVCLNPN